jgi:hypothetical protein
MGSKCIGERPERRPDTGNRNHAKSQGPAVGS